MKRVTTKISYVVPAWRLCNKRRGLVALKETCRFCIQTKEGPTCVLYSEQLSYENSGISKAQGCLRAMCGYESVVEDIEEHVVVIKPDVNPSNIAKEAIIEYVKLYNEIKAQGIPDKLAAKTALDYVLGKEK